MLNSIRRFLSPPTFGDADRDRIARLSTVLLQFMFVALLAGQLLSAILAPTPSFDIPLMFISCTAIAAIYVILRRGRLRAAGFLAALFMWGMFTAISALYQGVLGYFPAGYVLCILFASSTLGVGTGVFFAVLSSVSTLGLLLAETNGLLTPVMYTTPGLIDWLLLSLLFGMVVVVVTIVNQSLSTAHQHAHDSENEQGRATGIRASLEQRVAERTAQLNVSAEVARAVTSILEPQELLAQVTRLIVERFSLYHAAAFLADEDNEFAVLAEAAGQAGPTLKERGYRLEISGPSLVGAAIVTRRPCSAQDVNPETLRSTSPLLSGAQSEVALPLIVGEQVFGALDVHSTRPAAFDDETVEMLQSLANQIAIALNNAQQYQQAQLDARQASLLFEASQAAGFIGQGLDFAINRLFSVVAQHSDFDNWMMGICDQKNPSYTVKIAFAANEPAPSAEIGQVVKIDHEPATPAILALLAGHMLVANDPAGDPRLDPLPADQRAALGKLLSLPIKLGDRILGVLTMGRALDKPDIGPRDIQLAQALASQLAVAIENHRLLEQAQKSVDELNHLMRLYMHEGWSNFTQSRAAAELREEYGRLDAPPLRPEVLTQIDETLRQVTTASEVKSVDVDGQSVISVPIELRGEVLGALTVQDAADRRWTEDELATLQAVAAQVAQSLEAARLLEESETSLQDAMVLYRTSRAVAAAQTPAEILQAVADAIAAPEVDRAELVLIDVDNPADDQVVEIIAVWERNKPTPEQAGARWTNLQLPLLKHQITEPLIFGDLAQDENIDPQSRHVFLNVIGAKGMAIIPMIAGGRLLGWVLLESMQAPCRFTEQEIRRYRTLAGQAAVALENRRLFQDVQARVNELIILTRIGRRLASTLDLDEILSSVIDESFNATKAIAGGILLYNEYENALEARTLRGFAPEVEARHAGYRIHAGEGLVGRVLSTGEPVLSNDVTQEPDYTAVDSRTRSELILPIRKGGLLLGVLNLESPRVNAFSESDVRLLEAMADQAAVAITNARAYEAERQAVERMREVDRLKTQFLANMSHELRTPLNSIIGFSRVLLRGIDGPLTDMQQTDLTSIYSSGQHLLGLINNILDVSKIEAGKMELAIESVNLIDIAQTVMSTAVALVKDKPVKLEQDVPQDLPTVMADQTRVRQIILNLVSNAAKFTEKGTVRLSMVALPKEVIVSVSDTGIGIAPDKLEHVFEEFTQIDASTTRKYGGTGLGLAITRKFVEMHNGRIWVESQVGVGSTFNFTLPREQAEPEAPVSLPTDLEARGEGKKLIMRIDDDPGVITLPREQAEPEAPVSLPADLEARGEGKKLIRRIDDDPGVTTLPREQAEPEAPMSLPADLEARGKGKKLIMCIDGDPGVITLYKRYLEKQEYQVIGVTDPTKAVEEAKRLLPYAITLDVMMPQTDGWEVLADLKKTPEISSTPILVCSIIQDKTRGLSLGAADYLVKPITEDELQRALARVNRTRAVNKILIVDDEPAAVQLLKRILSAQPQFSALEASGGAEALALAQSEAPDLILLDLMMPEIDGFSVLEALKSNPATRDIPVIIVTAREVTAKDRERLNGNMAALCNKGMFTAEQLLADISTALQATNSEIVRGGEKVEVFHMTA